MNDDQNWQGPFNHQPPVCVKKGGGSVKAAPRGEESKDQSFLVSWGVIFLPGILYPTLW